MEQVKATNTTAQKVNPQVNARPEDKEGPYDPQANTHEASRKTVSDAAFKARKTEAAKAFAARQAELKTDRAAAIEELKAFFAERKLEMPPQAKAWINKETAVRKAGCSNFFNKVFGETPKVGDKVTLLEYMKLTLKAKAALDKYVKQWAEKGTVVEFKEDKTNLLNSEYVIVKLA